MHGRSYPKPLPSRILSQARRRIASQVAPAATLIAGVYDLFVPVQCGKSSSTFNRAFVANLNERPAWSKLRRHRLHSGLGYVMACAVPHSCAGGFSISCWSVDCSSATISITPSIPHHSDFAHDSSADLPQLRSLHRRRSDRHRRHIRHRRSLRSSPVLLYRASRIPQTKRRPGTHRSRHPMILSPGRRHRSHRRRHSPRHLAPSWTVVAIASRSRSSSRFLHPWRPCHCTTAAIRSPDDHAYHLFLRRLLRSDCPHNRHVFVMRLQAWCAPAIRLGTNHH